MVRHRLLFVAALAADVGACGRPAPARMSDRQPDLTLEVTFGGHERPPSLDPGSPSPRVSKAYAQLVGLVGHDFQFHFDEALIPRWRFDFDTLFAQCIETVVEDLADLRRSEPDVFREAAPKLVGLDVQYSVTALDDAGSRLDDGGTVHVVLTPRAWELVPSSAVSSAVMAGHRHGLDAAYAGKDPAGVSRAEWPVYWDWLRGAKIAKPATPDAGDDLVYYVDAPHVLAVARFAAVVGAGTDALRVSIEHWLGSASSFFRNGYEANAAVVRALPSTSVWKRAEQAWTRWATAAWPAMSDGARRDLLQSVVSSQGVVPPGLDAMPMGLDVMQAWVKAGHPSEHSGANRDPRTDLLTYVVCPSHVEDDGRIERSYNCGRFYDYALGDDARRRTLLAFVLAQHDGPLAAAVVLGSSHGTDNGLVVADTQWPETLAVWRGLAASDGLWRSATRVIAEGMMSYGGKLYDEAVLEWRRSAPSRGPLLYVIASIGASEGTTFKWEELPGTLGAPDARTELDDYLAQGHRALAMLPAMWPAIGSGWSRADVVSAHVDAVLDEVSGTSNGARDVAASLDRSGKSMCGSPNAAGERARLRQQLGARSKAHPDEARALAASIGALGETCR
jgi:hypothetical protein